MHMQPVDHHKNAIIDFITGQPKPNAGSERDRQWIERHLVEVKGYPKGDIDVDRPLRIVVDAKVYISKVDLVVRVKGKPYMAIKCAPGSLDSRQREIVSAAQLLEGYQIPLAVAASANDAIVWDTASGRQIGDGWEFVPTRNKAEASFDPNAVRLLPSERRQQVQLIFRSYDSMNVNR
jgi:hypothetical protein